MTLVVLLQLAGFVVFFVAEDRVDRLVDQEGWAHQSQLLDAELVRHGELVCTTSQDELFCVEADSGDVVFTQVLPGQAAPPALVDDTLVVAVDAGPGEGDLYGYSLQGELLWEVTDLQDVLVDDEALLRQQPPAVDQVVAVPLGQPGGLPDGVAGVDAASGDEVWRALGSNGPTGPSRLLGPYGELLSDGERFYADVLTSAVEQAVVALDAASGTELWRYTVATEPSTPVFLRGVAPVADGSAVALTFAGDEEAQVVVVDAAAGTARWDVPVVGGEASVTHVEGVTVVVDATTTRGFDDDGTELWSVPAPGGGNDPDDLSSQTVPELVAEDGVVYALDLELSTVDTSDGAVRQVPTRRRSGGAIGRPSDVAVAADHLVIAGGQLQGIPLEPG